MLMAPAGPEDRLDSWKEIAAYLRRGVRTVQRWERASGLPVHRLDLERGSSVYAYKAELDAWWRSRCQSETEATPQEEIEAREDVSLPVPRTERSYTGRVATALVAAFITIALLCAMAYYGLRPRSLPTLDVIPLTADIGDETAPSFSPDGKRIAYCARQDRNQPWHTYIKDIETDAVSPLGEAGTDSTIAPAWSPDGRTIAVTRLLAKSRRHRIVLVPASGKGSERVLLEEQGPADVLSWSADGQWLAAVASAGERSSRIVAVNTRTGARHALTRPVAKDVEDVDPAFSPDGRYLAYSHANSTTVEIYEQRLTNSYEPIGAPVRVTKLDRISVMPAYTPDGKYIVFSSGIAGDAQALWVVSSQGASWWERRREPRLLYRSEEVCAFPAMSRHGHRLAFASGRRGRADTWRLSVTADLKPEGKPSRLISSTHFDYNAVYSPDGKRIAFHSTRSGPSEIWTAKSDGSDARRLTNLKAPITGAPHWSPDGNWIVFDSNAGGQFDVYRISSKGGPAQRLTFAPGIDGVPSYSHDGRSIYFVSDRSGSQQVWKMNADGSSQRQITRKGGYAALESPDGKFLYYSVTTGFSPINRVPVDGGKEEQVFAKAHEFHFFPLPDGLLFSSTTKAIEFLDFKTGRRSTVYTPDRPMQVGLTVSPDRRYILFSQSDQEGSDLVFVKNAF